MASSTRKFDFINGPETSEIPVSTPPSADDDTITLGYAKENYVQGGEAVADLAALQAVAEADRKDNDIRYVNSFNRLYYFDSSSAETTDNKFIIGPDAGTGQWVHVDQATLATLSEYKDQTVTPANPSSGNFKFYFLNGVPTFLNDSGAEVVLGSGSGSGGINYIANPGAETDITGWTDTGGQISSNRSTTLPIRGVGSFIMATTASVTTADYVEYQFDLDKADGNKMLQLSFEHQDESSYDSGDFEVVIVKDPGGSETEIIPSVTVIPSTSSVNLFKASFVSLDQDTYSLRFKAAVGSSAYSIKVDTVSVGPEVALQANPETDWLDKSSDFAITNMGTVSDLSVFEKRSGDTVHLKGWFTVGTPSASPAYISLPYDMDTSKFNFVDQQTSLGYYIRIQDVAVATAVIENDRYGFLVYNSGFDSRLYFAKDSQSSTYTLDNGSSIGGSSEKFEFNLTFPVSGWGGSSVNLNTSKAEYGSTSGATWDADSSSDGSDSVFSVAGETMGGALTANRTKYITWQSPVQDTDIVRVELKQDSDSPWVTVSESAGAYDPGADTGIVVLNTTTPGVTRVVIKRYVQGTTDWTTSYQWRVVKYPGVIQSATVSNSVPVVMDDATATKLGHKVYEHGTTYNAGNAPTLSGPGGLSVVGSAMIPYQTQDSKWRMKFNWSITHSSLTTIDVSVNGLTWEYNAAFSGYAGTTSDTRQQTNGTGLNSCTMRSASATTTSHWSGDVPLAGKPSWAY